MRTLDARRLAADYSAAVSDALTAGQLAKARARNESERDPGIDHAHDFIDANECMTAAITKQLGTGWSWADHADTASRAAKVARDTGYRLRRILIGCEFSGIVRDEMLARGHDAMSCDTLPTEKPGPHYQGDLREIMNDGWHTMLSFPPCTYLAASQLWRCTPKHDPTRERARKSDAALEFVRDLMAARVDRWALENPVGRIGSTIRKADQIVQPYEYGHDASKQTCLWLHGLPPLVPDPADYVPPRIDTYKGKPVRRWANQTPVGADKTSPGPDRWKVRSRTYTGIARAMADQWAGVPKAEPGQLSLI